MGRAHRYKKTPKLSRSDCTFTTKKCAAVSNHDYLSILTLVIMTTVSPSFAVDIR